MKIIKVCEVCCNKSLVNVLNIGSHALCDDLKKIGDTTICKKYEINIKFCTKCYTAHQERQIDKSTLFPVSYHYRSRFTNDVLEGMKDLAKSATKKIGDMDSKLVLDVGCNDGSLLNYFNEFNAKTIGVEPTGAYNDINLTKHSAYNEYFTPELASRIVKEHGFPDVITFTNVFAHIDDINELIDSLKILISSRDIFIIIENHYLGSILKSNQFDTFYHEHPRTYSFKSFEFIASRLGLNITQVEFPSRYGGNIRVLLTNKISSHVISPPDESDFFKQFAMIDDCIKIWKLKKLSQLHMLFKKYGKLSAKAFPGRAAILVELLALNEDMIEAVYEKPGSNKIGHYLPGTKIPILSDDDMQIENINCIVNFAWHIAPEIDSYLKKLGYNKEILNIVESSDFIQIAK